MTEKTLPDAIGTDLKTDDVLAAQLPITINDPKIMSQLRKKRHLSGLMCPSMGVPVEEISQRK